MGNMLPEHASTDLSASVEESHLNMSLLCHKHCLDVLKGGLTLREAHLCTTACKHEEGAVKPNSFGNQILL